MNDKSDSKRVMPKGVRKGGARFPKQALPETLPWVKKLVVKTHLGPQAQDVILSGVVGNSNSIGQIRLSTIKQYGFLEGDSKAYLASALAKNYSSSPPEEVVSVLRKAALFPPIFKALFDTFQGDEVSVAKLKQRAAELKVHPEETEKCADNYISSLVIAGLAKQDGDRVSHIAAADLVRPSQTPEMKAEESDEGVSEEDTDEDAEEEPSAGSRLKARAIFNVTVSLDASLDAEKLEKQLKLLKRYGAI